MFSLFRVGQKTLFEDTRCKSVYNGLDENNYSRNPLRKLLPRQASIEYNWNSGFGDTTH